MSDDTLSPRAHTLPLAMTSSARTTRRHIDFSTVTPSQLDLSPSHLDKLRADLSQASTHLKHLTETIIAPEDLSALNERLDGIEADMETLRLVREMTDALRVTECERELGRARRRVVCPLPVAESYASGVAGAQSGQTEGMLCRPKNYRRAKLCGSAGSAGEVG